MGINRQQGIFNYSLNVNYAKSEAKKNKAKDEQKELPKQEATQKNVSADDIFKFMGATATYIPSVTSKIPDVDKILSTERQEAITKAMMEEFVPGVEAVFEGLDDIIPANAFKSTADKYAFSAEVYTRL